MKALQLQDLLSRFGLWNFVANLIAFAAVVNSVRSGLSVLTVLIAVLALVAVGFNARLAFPMVHRQTPPVGEDLVARFLVLTGAVIIGKGSTQPTLFWILVTILAVSLSFEPVIRELSSRSAPYVLNLDGIPNRKDTRFGYGLIYVANVIAIVFAYFAADGARWATIVFVVLVIIAAVLSVASTTDALGGYRARKASERVLYKRLKELNPAFAIYFHAPPDGVFHIGMWLPYFERLGEPFFIVVRNRRNFDDIRAITDRPIVFRKPREDLDDVMVPSLRAVFYGNLAVRNEHMIWYTHLTHVQMNHGESDKKSSFNPAYKMYDKAFVAGQAGIDRFAVNGVEIPEKAFTIVGRPQVENVEVATRSIRDVENKTVLYAPTWGGFHDDVSHCSLPVAEEIFSELLKRGCTIIFRPHPFSYRSAKFSSRVRDLQDLLAEDAKRHGRQHIFGKRAEKDLSIYECFNAADAMISDVSSVIGDFLFSEKPFAIVAIAAEAADFHTKFPVSRAGYIIDGRTRKLNGLSEALDELLDTDSLENRRKELRTYYLGDIPSENYAQRFVDEVRRVIRQPNPAPEEHNLMPG